MKIGWKDYDKSLKWLIANKDIDSRIVKSGQRESDNMYWFLVDFPEDKISNLEKIGFNINYNKSSVLVSEPINKEKTTPKYCINKNCRT